MLQTLATSRWFSIIYGSGFGNHMQIRLNETNFLSRLPPLLTDIDRQITQVYTR